MIDINFYRNIEPINNLFGKPSKIRNIATEQFIEHARSQYPTIFDIETTNACNMRCKMCPRMKMTRPVLIMDMPVYEKIISQIRPWSEHEWGLWETFAEEKYKVPLNEMSENNFFLYVIPRVVVLHGYGDPMYDPYIAERIGLLTVKGIPSYFSTNPNNVEIETIENCMEYGLNYLKFSIDGVTNKKQQEIRGAAANFSQAFHNLIDVLELKQNNGYKTEIVVTMVNVDHSQEAEFEELKNLLKRYKVYIYLKSQDQKWLKGDAPESKSIHWTESCKHPWASMSIRAGGEAVACPFDYNNQMIMGDTKTQSLYDIWNGYPYKVLRNSHINGLKYKGKCTTECDMHRIGEKKQ